MNCEQWCCFFRCVADSPSDLSICFSYKRLSSVDNQIPPTFLMSKKFIEVCFYLCRWLFSAPFVYKGSPLHLLPPSRGRLFSISTDCRRQAVLFLLQKRSCSNPNPVAFFTSSSQRVLGFPRLFEPPTIPSIGCFSSISPLMICPK